MNPVFTVIHSRRLIIRPFAEADVTDRYVAWLNDPDTVRFSERRHFRHTARTCQAYLASVREKQDWFLAIVSNAGPTHVGNISVSFDTPNVTADMAIMIGDPEARGKGYGLDAWSVVLDQLLGPAGIRKVTAGTLSANEQMLAVARKSGMVEEGRQRRQYLLDGEEVDRVLFARFAVVNSR